MISKGFTVSILQIHPETRPIPICPTPLHHLYEYQSMREKIVRDVLLSGFFKCGKEYLHWIRGRMAVAAGADCNCVVGVLYPQ